MYFDFESVRVCYFDIDLGMSSLSNHFSSNEPILDRSTHTAGIVQDTFAEEAGIGDEETTGGYCQASGHT